MFRKRFLSYCGVLITSVFATALSASEAVVSLDRASRRPDTGPATVGVCGTGGDCCMPQATPGCADVECCEIVCGCDAFCCNDFWDEACATDGFLGNGCGAGVLCTACGGGGCEGATGDCCLANPGETGCENAQCCETVCGCDPYCCNTEWDGFCATIGFQGNGCGAQLLCPTLCGGVDPCMNGVGDCCSAHANPGCDNADCCSAVCDCDPFCCSTMWDNFCATTGKIPGCGAELICGSLCGTGIQCPDGGVTFTNPLPGTVDARQPHPVGNMMPQQGIQTINVTGPLGANDDCWRMCETASLGAANSIQMVTDDGAGDYTITLARPITPGAVTRVSYNRDGGPATTATFISHPANVNGDAVASPLDVLAIVDCVNAVNPLVNCPWGIYSRDIDQSMAFNPQDILGVINLLNGADVFIVWNGTPLPSATCTP